MANGLWLKMQKVAPSVKRSREVTTVTAAVPATDETPAQPERTTTRTVTLGDEELEKAEAKLEEWEENNNKALGSINLHLHPSIAFQMKNGTSASWVWGDLESRYGKPGPAATYLELKKVLNTRIPDNADPLLSIDEMTQHLGRLSQMGFDIPKKIEVLILMAKLPPSMEAIAQELNTEEDDFKDLTIDSVRRMILLSWEQCSGNRRPQQQQNNQKLSAVKRTPGDPSFTDQQVEGEGSNRGGQQ